MWEQEQYSNSPRSECMAAQPHFLQTCTGCDRTFVAFHSEGVDFANDYDHHMPFSERHDVVH